MCEVEIKILAFLVMTRSFRFFLLKRPIFPKLFLIKARYLRVKNPSFILKYIHFSINFLFMGLNWRQRSVTVIKPNND